MNTGILSGMLTSMLFFLLYIGKERMILKDDHSVVTGHPKHYVGSSGSVWASEKVFLHWEHPHLYEIEGSPFDPLLCKFTAMVRDHLVYFSDSTEKGDVSCVTQHNDCQFRAYEQSRAEHAVSGIVTATVNWNQFKSKLNPEQIATGNEIADCIDALKSEFEILKSSLLSLTTTKEALWQKYKHAIEKYKWLIHEMKTRGLPVSVCPRVLLHTDKGPGVSVTNYEVKFRDAEIARLYDVDWQMRVHYAVNDPCPAERTNACIGTCIK